VLRPEGWRTNGDWGIIAGWRKWCISKKWGTHGWLNGRCDILL